MFALGAFSHLALNRRRATATSEGSAIQYIKDKAAFWTAYHAFLPLTHLEPISPIQRWVEILRTFLERLKRGGTEFLMAFKAVKYLRLKQLKYTVTGGKSGK
jgi:hypothetical protein